MYKLHANKQYNHQGQNCKLCTVMHIHRIL